MQASDSLAVGLAVGVPSFLVLVAVSLFWLRNQRRQKQEDMKELAIDLELQDNQSFVQFQQELHRPYNKNKEFDNEDEAGSATGSGSGSGSGLKVDKASVDHDNDKEHEYTKEKVHSSSNSNTNSNLESSDFDMNFKRHSKNISAYDFYETFIPILPNRESSNSLSNPNQPAQSQSQPPTEPQPADSLLRSQSRSLADTVNNSVPAPLPTTPSRIGRSGHKSSDSLDFAKPQTPGSLGAGHGSDSQNSSVTSFSEKDKRYSLDNLAKQLQHLSYFDKLPSRTNTFKYPFHQLSQASPLQSQPGSQPQTPKFERPTKLQTTSGNNSSNEFVNRLIADDAINDNYVYGG